MITDRQLLQLSERVNKRVALKLKIWEGIPLFTEKIDQESDTPFQPRQLRCWFCASAHSGTSSLRSGIRKLCWSRKKEPL